MGLWAASWSEPFASKISHAVKIWTEQADSYLIQDRKYKRFKISKALGLDQSLNMERILLHTQTIAGCVSLCGASLKWSDNLKTSWSGNPHAVGDELGSPLPGHTVFFGEMIPENSIGRELCSSSRHQSSIRKAYRPIRLPSSILFSMDSCFQILW